MFPQTTKLLHLFTCWTQIIRLLSNSSQTWINRWKTLLNRSWRRFHIQLYKNNELNKNLIISTSDKLITLKTLLVSSWQTVFSQSQKDENLTYFGNSVNWLEWISVKTTTKWSRPSSLNLLLADLDQRGWRFTPSGRTCFSFILSKQNWAWVPINSSKHLWLFNRRNCNLLSMTDLLGLNFPLTLTLSMNGNRRH
jgi:hypothetical protein